MKHALENKHLRIEVAEMGAELKSIQFQGKERLWPGERVWNRSSPVLFPVVGKSVDRQITVHGKSYPIGQHGFARDRRFQLISDTEDVLRFRLKSDGETLKHYPFDFELSITYRLDDDQVLVSYEVTNPGSGNMFFSIGAHPAFLLEEDQHTELRFIEAEDQERHLLTDGLFNGNTAKSLREGYLDLNGEDFQQDAIVYKGLTSDRVALLQDGKKKLEMDFPGFSYFGIWSKPNCKEFLCLEPWIGCADSAGFNQELEQKEGILELPSGRRFTAGWSVKFF